MHHITISAEQCNRQISDFFTAVVQHQSNHNSTVAKSSIKSTYSLMIKCIVWLDILTFKTEGKLGAINQQLTTCDYFPKA